MSIHQHFGLTDDQTGLAFTLLTTVFFLFPPELPVTGSNMNYAIAVFGFIRASSLSAESML
jgi:hypothetical protein